MCLFEAHKAKNFKELKPSYSLHGATPVSEVDAGVSVNGYLSLC